MVVPVGEAERHTGLIAEQTASRNKTWAQGDVLAYHDFLRGDRHAVSGAHEHNLERAYHEIKSLNHEKSATRVAATQMKCACRFAVWDRRQREVVGVL